MKKICLTLIGLYVGLFAGFAQNNSDSSEYKSRKLNFEEANFVSGYYHQDGNHAAVTGGTGSEKLTDLSNTIEVKLYNYDRLFRKNNWNLELGIDHYTSASSDMIDLKANSSASHADTRFYPSINWTRENEKKGTTIGGGLSFSKEFDYTSLGANINIAKKTNDRNGEFTAKIQGYLDKVTLIYPTELRPGYTGLPREKSNYTTTPRNSISTSLSWSQVVNKRLQMQVDADLAYQQGYLGLPFHRVYFTDQSVHVENLPTTRKKIPLAIRANYFVGDKVILRAYYRYYTDDWGLKANTASLEVPVKLNPFFSLTPFYRHYIQTAVKYFAPYQTHTSADTYYTSNYDLSAFTSEFFGAGIRMTPPKGVFGFQRLGMLELRYGHYTRSEGMQSDVLTLNLQFR